MKKFLFLLLLSFTSVTFCNNIPVTNPVDFLSHPIQLDEARIETIKTHYATNFKMRSYLKHGYHAALLGIGGAILYQMGMLDPVIPRSLKPEIGDVEKRLRVLELWKQVLEQKVPELSQLVQNQSNGRMAWIWGGIKSITSWVALSAGVSKLATISNYVETEPTFHWFFTNHNLTIRIETLKKSVKSLTQASIPDIYLEHHEHALLPALAVIGNNCEEFIAFMHYYFDRVGADLIELHGMDSMPRYVFNITNDFFQKFFQLLSEEHNKATLIGLIDEYKADMINSINRCQFFENDMNKPVINQTMEKFLETIKTADQNATIN